MKSDVSQDSILGLLLFIIFNNDTSVVIHSYNYLLFVDDLKMYHGIRNADDFNFEPNDKQCSGLVLTQLYEAKYLYNYNYFLYS
jgi:hypothetical protein